MALGAVAMIMKSIPLAFFLIVVAATAWSYYFCSYRLLFFLFVFIEY